MSRLAASLVVLAAVAVAGLGPGASRAAAAPSMEIGVADDRLLFAHPDLAAATADEWRASGVDVVRIFARWGAFAPSPSARTRPAGFDPANPDDPGYDWRALDRAVGTVTAAGLRVMLTVTGWGPVWGSEFPVRRNPRYTPDPARFADFATAVARRYGGAVDRYVMWNEPNVAQWLQPQAACTRSRCVPYAPHHYRRLARAGAAAVRAADPGAEILVGSLAPRGTSGRATNGNTRPLTFLREMGCVTRSYRRTRSGRCRGFSPVSADGLAYHPHGLRLSPTQPDRVPDQAQLADIGQVISATDRITRAGGIDARGGRLPLWLDEYAYQTRPPDRILGVSPSLQSRWMQQGSYLAWRNPRVRNLTWYVWRDEPVGPGGGGWQSGLRYRSGRAKPALAAFAHPFWAFRRKPRTARLWGQVRPGGATSVTIERRSGGAWRPVAQLQTDAWGGFRRDVRITRTTTFRFSWDGGHSGGRTVRP